MESLEAVEISSDFIGDRREDFLLEGRK